MARKDLNNFICYTTLMDLLATEDEEEEDEILDESFNMLVMVNSTRYLQPRTIVPKNLSFLHEVLPQYDDVRFKRLIRMNREQFFFVLSLIENHEVFNSFNCNQYPVVVQLLIALSRFGTFGNRSAIMPIAREFAVGDGGTLNIFTCRVITALLSLEKHYLQWPDKNERKEIGNYMAGNLLPDCIGFVDGTHIILEQAPKDDPISYFNRKGRYSLNVQIVCDPYKRIRNYHIGQPGKVHDARVFGMLPLSVNPHTFFDANQFIVGDAAYKLTPQLITPFRNGPGMTREQDKFNKHLSKKRIIIEHVNGMLKRRFASLRGLRMVVDRKKGHKLACQWTLTCMILHNIAFLDETWDEEEIENREVGDDAGLLCAEQDGNDGRIRRNALFVNLLPFL